MSKNCLKNQYQAKKFRRFTYQAKTLWIHDHWTLAHLSIKNTKPTDLSIVSQTPLYVQKSAKKPVPSQKFSAFHIPSQNFVDSRSLDPNTLIDQKYQNNRPLYPDKLGTWNTAGTYRNFIHAIFNMESMWS